MMSEGATEEASLRLSKLTFVVSFRVVEKHLALVSSTLGDFAAGILRFFGEMKTRYFTYA